jgi:hypothetical protein
MIYAGTPANLNTPLRLRCIAPAGLASSGQKYPGGGADRPRLTAAGAKPPTPHRPNPQAGRKEHKQ